MHKGQALACRRLLADMVNRVDAPYYIRRKALISPLTNYEL